MATRYITRSARRSSQTSNANSIRIDPATNELKIGIGPSGTNEKTVVDTDALMALTARVEALEGASLRKSAKDNNKDKG